MRPACSIDDCPWDVFSIIKKQMSQLEEYGKDVVQQIDLLKKIIAKLESARDLLLARLMNGEITVYPVHNFVLWSNP